MIKPVPIFCVHSVRREPGSSDVTIKVSIDREIYERITSIFHADKFSKMVAKGANMKAWNYLRKNSSPMERSITKNTASIYKKMFEMIKEHISKYPSRNKQELSDAIIAYLYNYNINDQLRSDFHKKLMKDLSGYPLKENPRKEIGKLYTLAKNKSKVEKYLSWNWTLPQIEKLLKKEYIHNKSFEMERDKNNKIVYKENPDAAWGLELNSKHRIFGSHIIKDSKTGKWKGLVTYTRPGEKKPIRIKLIADTKKEILDWIKKHIQIGHRSNPIQSNPKGKLIYDNILAIEAEKGASSLWPGEKFRHDFKKSKGKAKIYGMPDGSLRIAGDKKLWKNFKYGKEDI